VSYYHRFRHRGNIDDLEKALEHFSRALELTPDGHPDLSLRHANLGVSYSDRFQHRGNIDDLGKALGHFSRGLELTPDGHPHLSDRHANLGVSYSDRFRHRGNIDDLEKALEHHSRALELTPDGHPYLSVRHANLGASYRDRFRHRGNINDLEKALEHFSRALELTPDGHPSLSRRHASLGVSYGDRFHHRGNIDDIEKALEHHYRALELTSNGHPDLSNRHAELGVSYNDRFRHRGNIDDVEKALEHFSRALELTPDSHPDLSHRHHNRALSYFDHYRHTNNLDHLQQSLHSFRRASQVEAAPSRQKFRHALEWAALASNHSSLMPIEAYRAAIHLLPQFIWLGATTIQRYHHLLTAENLAIRAAYAAILHSDFKLALEWLEHGRCVVWNQSLMLRSPLDLLHSSHPELATRLEAISKQLNDASSVTSTSQMFTSGSTDPERVSRQRHRLAMEYKDLLAEAHKLPGFENFLQPMKANALVDAARNGPIVVINCHQNRCDALLILPRHDIRHIHLPNFTEQNARDARSELEISLRRKGLRERGFKIREDPEQKDRIGSVLAALWTNIIKPVVSAGSLPHITWCPTGAISFLPLHAAGDYDQPRCRVFDYVISSYTPTLTALLTCTPSSFNRASRMLAIGQANTPGCTPLPGTTRELERIKTHMHDKAEYSQLVGKEATTAAVLDAMEQHDWVHLACHAHQNVQDPTKSGFYLHDGTLDLASINRQSFKNKGLAFLSACQTATGDEKLPDEAIHLASGMLMAGYPSVIATMWSVKDEDAPFVADKVYAELMKDGKVGNGEAGKALHNAVAGLRDKVGEKEFARWAPYIHIGS
ncbi:hypothetical protein FRC11_009289, partial [Ceratobasidium sp. 423]